MMKPAFLAAVALLSTPAFTQSAPLPPTFEVADVHPGALNHFNFIVDPVLRGNRYIIHQRTLAELVGLAYGVDSANVYGGPPWLERDNFEIVAKAAPGTPPATLKLMLQQLLADRFHLVVHNDAKPLPAFALRTLDAKPRMKLSADPTADNSGCRFQNVPRGPGALNVVSCQNVTMDDFAVFLHNIGGNYFPNPVLDATHLTQAFDFDFKWTPQGQLAQAGPDGISIFDAVQKQLGLKLDLQTSPRPVIVVDSATETPTPNRPDLAKVFPPPPPPEFDVASIKPSKPDTNETNANIGGNQVNVSGATIQFMIQFAWNLNPNDPDAIADAPKWLGNDRFDILAKAATPALTSSGKRQPIDPEDLRAMIRQLLAERFHLQVHTEERPLMGYVLTAANPKLTPADPTARSSCKDGPGPDGKDPRIANPMLGRLLYCRNMSMAQFAQDLQWVAGGYIYGDVLDQTNLPGSYNFLLNFSSSNQLRSDSSTSTNGISDPNGALSLFDALSKQLGLKLEKRKRPMPVLVIDHIEEKPTEG